MDVSWKCHGTWIVVKVLGGLKAKASKRSKETNSWYGHEAASRVEGPLAGVLDLQPRFSLSFTLEQGTLGTVFF